MSRPAIVNLSIWQGNIEPFAIVLRDGSGDAIDPTGKTIVLTTHDLAEGTLTKSTADGSIIIEDGATPSDPKRVRITFTAPQTRQLKLGSLSSYEIEVRSSGIEQTIMAGYFVVSGGNNGDA